MRIGLGLGVSASSKPPAEIFPTSLPIVPAAGSSVTSVLQPDGSYLATKTGASAWNTTSSLVLGGVETLDGDFVIVVEPLNLSTFAMVGIDATVNGGHDNTTMTKAMLLNGGTLYENQEGGGTAQGPNAYGGATVFFMRRVGSTVTFLKGNTHNVNDATLVFTSALSLPPTHFFSSTFYDLNGQWKIRVYEG